MPDWRKTILDKITYSIKPIILVSDPDNLLGDQKIQTELNEKGYLTYQYTDHILFRYTYETQYKTRLEKTSSKLIIITDQPQANINQKIPYDLLKKCELKTISLNKLFPKLDYPALKEVITTQIDRLYRSYQNYKGERIGNKQTKEYLLTTLYGIDPAAIITQNDYILSLINKQVPDILVEYLNNYLKNNQYAPTQYYDNENELLKNLQSEWKKYVQNNKKQSILNDQKIRSSIIQSFINNKLQPIPVSNIEKYPNWMQFGLIDDSIENSIQVIKSNLEKIQAILESPESPNNREWRTIAQLWAEILYQANENELEETIMEQVREFENNVDKEFIPWVLENHQSLYYKRERKPITLSHINDYINHNHNDSKTAIIVIDGMSTEQWLKIKQCLEKQSEIIQFEENLVYAAIPTITSISRQTIASGNEPTFFKNDSQAFSKEESLWASNWQKRDKTTGYKKGLKLLKKDEIKELEKIIDKQSILIITDYLDKKIHEATNGKHEINREIEYWVKNGILYS
ncbi:MAG: BREX-3 system phosphatase PglZ, partial [Candidatus Hodarchaeales archaeon]